MANRQATPEGAGRSRPDSFSYHWTAPDQPWTGWVAGPVNWIEAHTSDHGSKPCLVWITYNALPCPRCKPHELTEKIGYLPVYREIDNAPILVILHDNMWVVSESLSHGSYIKVSRPGGAKAVVAVQLLLNKKPFVPGLPRRKHPVDLTHMLLKMWKISELTSWFECQEAGGTMLPPVKVDAGAVPARVAARVKLDLEKIAGMVDVEAEKNRERADAENALAKRLRKMKEAEQNGKHD